jgi:hypothetical protein
MTNDHTLRLDIEALALDYFAEYEIDSEGHVTDETNAQRSSRAWSLVDGVATWNRDQGWDLILMLLELAPSSADVSHLAAGPLEDLVRDHGLEFQDRIAAEAERNSRLRDALAGVWGWDQVPTAVRDRLLQLAPKEIRDHWVKLVETEPETKATTTEPNGQADIT